MIRPAPTTIALLAASAAALAAGCGEGDPLSAEELVSRGDEICREGADRFAEIQERPPDSAGDAAEQTEELVEVAEDDLERLEDLRPPEQLSDRYERYLEARREALETLTDGRDAAEDGDARGYEAAQTEVVREGARRRKLARAVGFKVCSAEPG